jgi:uncharacterized tellurite resistance protein B-like protein
MFERLINSIGQPAQPILTNVAADGELLLAAAKVLFAALPVDYSVTSCEGVALRTSLIKIFALSPEKCHRVMSRAAAAHSQDSSILAATTLLKHRTSESFRRNLLAELNLIIRADGILHDNELDLEHRAARLLGLSLGEWQRSA